MKRHPLFTALPVASLVLAALLVTPSARADVPGINMDFEDYELGELLGQDAWGYAGGWAGSWEIVEHEGPDGTTTKCLGSVAGMTSNWPRGHFTVATDRVTKYGWPTTGTYKLSFDCLFTKLLPVNIYVLGAQKAYVFQISCNTKANRIQTNPGGLFVQNLTSSIAWHHIEANLDFSTSSITFTVDGNPFNNGASYSFSTPAADMASFGQIILQYAADPTATPNANDGFYLDNLRIYRTDVDPSEITVVLVR